MMRIRTALISGTANIIVQIFMNKYLRPLTSGMERTGNHQIMEKFEGLKMLTMVHMSQPELLRSQQTQSSANQ